MKCDLTRSAAVLAATLSLAPLPAQGIRRTTDHVAGDSRGAGGGQRGGGEPRTGGLDRRGGIERPPVSGPDRRVTDARRGVDGGPRSPVRTFPNSEVVFPRYTGMCTQRPDRVFWGHRDIMAEIQWHARQGFVPVVAVGEEQKELSDVALFPAGWKSYGFVVPPGGKLHVRLHHPNEGWFRLAMTNKWGNLEKGMLQNLIPTGNPEVSYHNLSSDVRAVYVIVDDPGWMSSKAYPFFLDIQRDWEPGRPDLRDVKPVQGIWAQNPTAGFSAEFSGVASFSGHPRW